MKPTLFFLLPGFSGILDSDWRPLLENYSSNSLLDKMISRSSKTVKPFNEPCPFSSFQATLTELFSISDQVPWAWYGIRGIGFRSKTTDWFKLNLLNRHNRINFNPKIVHEIAGAFAAEFSFAEDSIITKEGDWYLSLGDYSDVSSTVPWLIEERSLRTIGLSGSDAPLWQLRFKEAHNWLQNLPLNQHQKEPIQYIWPWGNRGTIPLAKDYHYTAIFAQSPIYRGLAEHLGLAYFDLDVGLADIDQMIENHKHICIIDDTLLHELSYERFSLWEAARERLIAKYLDPVMRAVENKTVGRLIIDDGLGCRYQYERGFNFRFSLRRPKVSYHFNDHAK